MIKIITAVLWIILASCIGGALALMFFTSEAEENDYYESSGDVRDRERYKRND